VDEHLLQHLLGLRGVADDAPRQPEQDRGVAVVERGQGLLVAAGDPGDEVGLAPGARGIGGQGSLPPATGAARRDENRSGSRAFTIPCAPVAKDRRRLQLAVVGAGRCGARVRGLAREVGAEVARAGAVLLTGGRGGVMAAASAGARAAGGLTVGILPGTDAAASPPNPAVEVAVFTGIGQARNQVLVLSAAAVVAVGGGWGTLSEIALALKFRVPVVALKGWNLRRPDGLTDPLLSHARTPADAVALALAGARRDRAVPV
jgi:uncharacterized protein (TIGR00725 family)